MQDIICGAVSGPNPVVPMTVAHVWYALSMAHSRMATSVSSTFSNVSCWSLVTCHSFSPIICSVSVKEFDGMSKKDPTSGAFVHYLVERRAYSCRYMMYLECPFVGWSSFLMRLVPEMSWAWRCQRLLKLGLPCILSIVPMAVLIFSALYFTMLVIWTWYV